MSNVKAKKNTLLKVLISIIVLIILIASVLVGLEPSTRLSQERNSDRYQEIESILDAILSYQVDNNGDLPKGIDTNLKVLGTDESGCDIACGSTSFEFTDIEQADFEAGSYSLSQYNSANQLLELTEFGLLGGLGAFTSRVFDAGGVATWDLISWEPQNPYGKELPNYQGSESGYIGGGTVNMSGNQLLLHMNENNWNGIQNEVIDSSVNRNHGISKGLATTTINGRFKRAGIFNKPGDYITIADDISLEFATQFTMAGWFYFDSDIGSAKLVEKANEYALYTYDNGDFGYNDAILFEISSNGEPEKISVNADLALSDLKDRWVFISAVYNGYSLNLYVNNSLVASSIGEGLIHNGEADLIVGSSDVDSKPFGSRRIDEFAMWDRALSINEINNLYQRGALNLRFQVRSCDDKFCSGEVFIGPDGTSTTYYSEVNSVNTGTPSFDLFDVNDNQYFQYQVLLMTEHASYSPQINSVKITSNQVPLISTSSCLDLSEDLVSNYISTIPYDESIGNPGNTRYAARVTSGGRVNVIACTPEAGEIISVQR